MHFLKSAFFVIRGIEEIDKQFLNDGKLTVPFASEKLYGHLALAGRGIL
jgi:hypothetical protein